MDNHRVVIIGGGVCGLGTALGLGRKGGFSPLVLERESEPGGLARCLHFKGVSTDLGPHRLHTELPEVYDLVSEVAAPSLITVKRTSRIYLRGKYISYPPSPVETALHLGPIQSAKFGLSMALEMVRPAASEESYESLMRGAFGSSLYEFMLRPYTKKVWKTDPTMIHPDTARVRVSAGSLMKMLKGLIGGEKPGQETSLKQFRYVRGGIETLVRHLREHAEAVGTELRVSRQVQAIDLAEDSAGGWKVTGLRCEGEDAPIRGDSFVSTVPLPVLLGDLLPQVPELADAREAATGLTYINMIFVCIIVRRKVISGDNWLYYPEEDLIFNRAYEAKNFDETMGPEDKSVLCVELTTLPGDAMENESDDAIQKEVIAQMVGTGLFDASEVEEAIVYRLPYGYPLYSLDYRERLDTTLDGLRKISNLLSSGRQGLFNHNNTDHSIYMGLRGADSLAESLASPGGITQAQHWYDRVEEFKHFRIVD